jgi:serine acetyltransferase
VFPLVRADARAFFVRKPERFPLLVGLLYPNVRACFWIRLALASPWPLYTLCRAHLLSAYGIDVTDGASIGPGLCLPHPTGICIGYGVDIGESVTIFQHVSLGNKNGHPTIASGVVIWTNAVVVGPIHIGEKAEVGANTFLDQDLAAGAVWKGRAQATG